MTPGMCSAGCVCSPVSAWAKQEGPRWGTGGFIPPAGRSPFPKQQSPSHASVLTLPKNFCFLRKRNTAQLHTLPLCSKSSWTPLQGKDWDSSFYFPKGALSTRIEEPSLDLSSKLTRHKPVTNSPAFPVFWCVLRVILVVEDTGRGLQGVSVGEFELWVGNLAERVLELEQWLRAASFVGQNWEQTEEN